MRLKICITTSSNVNIISIFLGEEFFKWKVILRNEMVLYFCLHLQTSGLIEDRLIFIPNSTFNLLQYTDLLKYTDKIWPSWQGKYFNDFFR